MWLNGWGFDWIYERLLVRPFLWLAQINRNDIVDSFYKGTASVSRQLNGLLSVTQNGQVRWYLASLVCGAILFLALLVAL
jgi:NADH-quinone oxidoreductase subunit L